MISIQVKLDKLKIEYPDIYEFFLTTLRNSNSKYKNYSENKIKCYYYLGFYMLPSKKTKEYYENLYTLKYDQRKIEERKKVKITITLVAGKFALSDQRNMNGETLEKIFNEIVKRKIYTEQLEIQNDEIINSIPDLDDFVKKLKKEQEQNRKLMEDIFSDSNFLINKQKKMSPQEQLNKLIDNEKYEEANNFIKKHPELKKRNK